MKKCKRSKAKKESGGPGTIGRTEPITPRNNKIIEITIIKVVI